MKNKLYQQINNGNVALRDSRVTKNFGRHKDLLFENSIVSNNTILSNSIETQDVKSGSY